MFFLYHYIHIYIHMYIYVCAYIYIYTPLFFFLLVSFKFENGKELDIRWDVKGLLVKF